MKRVISVPVLAFLFLIVLAPAALAHGEAAQEGFLRMETVAWFNVEYSGDGNLDQGEEMTVTGQVKILETWPDQLDTPEMGFLGIAAPGPVVLIKERTINGRAAPHSFQVEKGETYDFTMTVAGRRPGEWHLHPILGVEGAGSLLGPGRWVTVNETGNLVNEQTLYNGQTVDLERYQMGSVVGWHWLGLVIGVVWMLYWTVPKATVTRLAVTSQIPLNTDGQDIGLITKRDHRWMNVLAGITLLSLIIGYVWQSTAFPVKIPIQVLRFEPTPLVEPEPFAEVAVTTMAYDVGSNTLTMVADVTNTSNEDIEFTEFTTSTLTFATDPTGDARPMEVDTTSIGAGDTETVTINITDEAFQSERLIPIAETQRRVTGVMIFENGDEESRITVNSLVDANFGGQ